MMASEPSDFDTTDRARSPRPATTVARPEIAACRRVVLKLGTRVLADDTGRLVTPRLRAIVDTAAALRRSGREVVLVSSGAVGLGRRLLGLEAADDPAERRACAAAGQSRLMGAYQRRFAAQDLICAQVLLTDVDGVFDADPRHDPTACVIHRLENLDAVLTHLDAVPGSGLSRGGMRAKVEAAKLASQAGAHVVIARADDVDRVVAGDEVGSWARATTAPPARRRWIAWSAAVRGTLHLDAGAVTALCERHASLLPVGVRGVDGKFSVGDVVELRGPSGALIGRGLMSYDAETVRAWCRGLAPDGDHNCLIRRNDVFFVENGP